MWVADGQWAWQDGELNPPPHWDRVSHLPAPLALTMKCRPGRLWLRTSWIDSLICLTNPHHPHHHHHHHHPALQAWASAVADKLEVQLERLAPGSGFKQAS